MRILYLHGLGSGRNSRTAGILQNLLEEHEVLAPEIPIQRATEKRLEELERQVSDMWINNHRQAILTFARECRQNIPHSSDEWSNVLNVAEEYERYVEDKHITNGIISQDTQYLRNLYQELSMEHKF